MGLQAKNSDDVYTCDKCKKTFKTKGGFTKHMKGHSETIAKKNTS